MIPAYRMEFQWVFGTSGLQAAAIAASALAASNASSSDRYT